MRANNNWPAFLFYIDTRCVACSKKGNNSCCYNNVQIEKIRQSSKTAPKINFSGLFFYKHIP